MTLTLTVEQWGTAGSNDLKYYKEQTTHTHRRTLWAVFWGDKKLLAGVFFLAIQILHKNFSGLWKKATLI